MTTTEPTTGPTGHTTAGTAAVHDTLVAERAEHQARLTDLPPDDPIVETLVASLEAVDAALASLDAGTYGSCTECGVEIPTERLEAVPSATVCVGCLGRPRALFS